MPKTQSARIIRIARKNSVPRKPVIETAKQPPLELALELAREVYILEATQFVKTLQRDAETIARKCQRVISECNGTRTDIEILQGLDLTDDDTAMIELKDILESFNDVLNVAAACEEEFKKSKHSTWTFKSVPINNTSKCMLQVTEDGITYAWISKQTLQKQLGWDEHKADRVRKALDRTSHPSSRPLNKQMYQQFKKQFEAAAAHDVQLQQHAPKVAATHCWLYDFDTAITTIVQNM
jgi:hypothetical protein